MKKFDKKFNHRFLPDIEMGVETIPSVGRFYTTPEGNRYQSVTTFLSKFGDNSWVEEWRAAVGEERANEISKRATDRGESLHLAAEYYLRNRGDYLEAAGKQFMLFKSIKRQLDHIDNVLCLENALYSDALKIAGRVDCIAEWKGVLSVIDFKTSTNYKSKEDIDNYFLQTTCYALMLKERYGISVSKLVIIIAVEKHNCLVYEENVRDWIPRLAELVRKTKSPS